MNKLALLLISLLSGSTAFAQALQTDAELLEGEEEELRRYTVEIIVFAYKENVSLGSEIFVPEIVAPTAEAPIETSDPDENGRVNRGTNRESRFEMVQLGRDELTMTTKREQLERLDAYEPMLHFGWTQTALPEDETPTLDLNRFGRTPAGLAGKLSLYLSRYLHLVVDMELAADDSDSAFANSAARNSGFVDPLGDRSNAADNSGSAYYRERENYRGEPVYAPLRYTINEDRLFKNGEIRYFDHPKFGVIAKVTRFEVEEVEQQPDDTEFLSPAVVGE